MPVYCYTCSQAHTEEVVRPTIIKRNQRRRCKQCGLWAYRDVGAEFKVGKTKTLLLNPNHEPGHHLLTKRSTKGFVIEHLGPTPVYVETKKQYDDLLRKTRSREKDSGYAPDGK